MSNLIERLQRENKEVMRQKAYQYQRAKKAEEELAALKASTEQPVAVVHEVYVCIHKRTNANEFPKLE